MAEVHWRCTAWIVFKGMELEKAAVTTNVCKGNENFKGVEKSGVRCLLDITLKEGKV